MALNPDFEDPIFDGERIILLSNLNVLGLMVSQSVEIRLWLVQLKDGGGNGC